MCGIWDGFFLFPAVPSSPADAAVESRASMVIGEPCHPRQAIETSPQQCDPTAGIIRSSYSHFQTELYYSLAIQIPCLNFASHVRMGRGKDYKIPSVIPSGFFFLFNDGEH